MTPKLKKIILFVVIVGVLFAIYTFFIKPGDSADVLIEGTNGLTGGTVNEDAQILGSQISQALLKIEQIRLDKSVFSNPILASLQDRSQPIIEEPIGRANPFAPLGEISISTQSRTSLNMASGTPSRATSTATTTRAN